jgi:hypothetical protein
MRASIAQRFREEFSWPYLERLFAGMFDAHRLACADSQQYSWPESMNWEWNDRRAKLQTLAHEVAEQVPGVTAIASNGDDEVKSPIYHRRIQHGRAIITISAASSPDEVKPDCHFRHQYIQAAYRQYSLFENDDADVALADDDYTVYGLLLQGRGLEPPGELGFAVIRFPFRDAPGYHAVMIDLFKEFPQVVALKRPGKGGQDGDDLDIDFHEGEGFTS